jgi:hypothetical protein
MSTVNNGPQIVRNGLVLDLDASYMRSYSPNVMPNPTDIFAWAGVNAANAATLSRDTTMTRQYGSIPMKMAVTGNDPFTNTINYGPGALSTWNLAPAANGQTWTISVYVKASVATTGELFLIPADSNGVAITSYYGAISISTSWTRVSFTATISAATTAFIQGRLDGPNSGGAGINIWWDGMQVERASSATTFNPYYIGNTIWRDVSGNNRSGTLTNGPLLNASNYGSIAFDGSDDYITSVGSSIVPTSTAPYTVSVWCYRNSNNLSYRELLSQWTNANSGNSFYFGFENSNVRFTDNWTPVTVAGAGNTNVWMNLVGVYTVSNAYIYLNGVLVATKGSGFTYTGTGPLIIGRQGELNGEYFDGRIANVLIYNTALSAQQIMQNFQADKSRFGL